MHPIERLRYVARADGAGPGVLVRETGLALCDMDLDPQSLVLACRRIVERHPTMAQLWWLCAHVLAAPDPSRRLANWRSWWSTTTHLGIWMTRCPMMHAQ